MQNVGPGRNSRPSARASAVGVVAVLAIVVGGSVVATGSSPVAMAAAVPATEAPDFATEVYGDPWDFSNDADTDAMFLVENVAAGAPGRPGERTFHFDGLRQGDNLVVAPLFETQLFVVPNWGKNALPLGRDGGAIPIDSTRYSKLSVRATWTGSGQLDAGVFFGTCTDDEQTSCQGMHPVGFQPGGPRVYTFDLSGSGPFPSHPAAWGTGDVVKFLVQLNGPSVKGATLTVDWMRLHGDSGEETDAFPPGVHTVYDTTYDVGGRPHPVVHDPDLAGGHDYATVARGGDAWDFAQLSDASYWANVDVAQGSGRLEATTSPTGATWDNPEVVLASPQARINTRRWHRLTIRSGLNGPFSLEFAPGGGAHGRIVWTNEGVPHDNQFQESRPVVVGTGESSFTIDLHTSPIEFLMEPDLAGQGRPLWGWGGPNSRWVSRLRWDAHEDPGPRSWWLDDVRLARNDLANPTFPITFSDQAWAPGTVADLYLVDAAGAGGGVKVNADPIDVVAGTNTFVLDSAALSEQGIFWVRVEMTRGPVTTSAWSTGPVETSTPVEFVDVIPGDPFFAEVFWLVKAKVASGVTVDEYRPRDAVTRGAMASFLFRLANQGAVAPGCSRALFPDVATSNPFCGAIDWLYGAGVVTGGADGWFSPQAPVSRQSMAVFLYRLANPGVPIPACTTAPFPDVPTSNPFCGAIDWLATTQITGGYSDGTYRPAETVSRQAMAAFLQRYDANL